MQSHDLFTSQAKLDHMPSHHGHLGEKVQISVSEGNSNTSSSSVLVMSIVSTMWQYLVWLTLSMCEGKT